MLSSKNLTATEAIGYHGKEDDRKFNGSYQSEFSSGWFGKGSATLSLTGEVVPEVFNQLALGVDLNGNSLHAKPINPENHRAGTDFCFSAPKSVSIAALLQQDRRILAAHNNAVMTALTALEDRYPQARIWNRQQQSQERIFTENITAALFPHSTSRNHDPQLHTHAFILNTTQLEDGSWRALSNEEMIASKKFVGQIYQNQLAYNLRQIGYEIEPRKNGQFELERYSKDLCDLFSSRRQQIENYAEQSERSKDAKLYEQATLHTRQHKKEIPLDALIEGWRRAIAEQGLELPPVPQADQTQELSETGRERAATAAFMGLEIAESQEFEFRREAIEQPALENSVGQQSWEQLQTAIDEMNQLIAINLLLNLYTTEAAMERKKNILQVVQQGWGVVNAIASPENVGEMDTEFLTEKRRQALEMAATSTNQFSVWQGIGKDEQTHALTLYRQLAENQGYTIREFNPQIDLNQFQGSSKEIWIVSEAESLTMRDVDQLVQNAKLSQTRVLFIGDEKAPGGDAFKALPNLGITTINLRTGKRLIPDEKPENSINLTYKLENSNASDKTWKKATPVKGNSRTLASDRATRRNDVENCVGQSVGERVGTAIGKRIGEQLAATQPEDRFSVRTTRFAGIDVEQTAIGIAEAIERRAIERCSQDLGRTFEEIDGCLRQHRSDIQRLEGVLRKFENNIRWSEKIHHRATSKISARGVTENPEAVMAESASASNPPQSQEKAKYQSEFAEVIIEAAALELEPSKHEWLPERDDRNWETVRHHLVTEYKIPDWLLQALHDQGWIYSDKKKRAVFVERDLDDKNYHGLTLSGEGTLHPTERDTKHHANSSFWIADSEPFDQAIIVDDPLEVLAICALNRTGNRNLSTLYLAVIRAEQLPLDLLRDIPKVRVSTSCEDEVKQALKENVPQRTLINPNHAESWRGVWKDWVNDNQVQPRENNAVARLQMQL